MSTTTKIIVIAGATVAVALTGFLFATPKGNEIRKKGMEKLLSGKNHCHDVPAHV